MCHLIVIVYSPSLYSSRTSMYAYSRPKPFLGSSTPCSFAMSVVLPEALSPSTNTDLFDGNFVLPCFCTSPKISDLHKGKGREINESMNG